MLTKYNKKIRRASKTHAKLRQQGKIRIVFFKSNRHLYVQLIDDSEGKVLYALSTLSEALRAQVNKKVNKEVASILGSTFAELCPTDKLIAGVVFDKGAGKYCGVVKAFAEAAHTILKFHEV